jgi:HupH hydrogenase expression protein, C-terminal conserved region
MPPDAKLADFRTGLAAAILQEVAERLDDFVKTGESASIDLRSLPMTDADRAELEEWLGHGEVMADLDVAGESQVWETAYAGVWWIRHLGAGGRIAAEEIAVVAVPDILVSHQADIAAAAVRLRNLLDPGSPPRPDVGQPQ